MLAGSHPLDRAGRRAGPPGRDRGRHRERPGRAAAGRAARHRAAGGTGPDQVGDRQQRRDVAARAGSPWACRRPACPSAAAASTSASRWRSSRAAGMLPAGGLADLMFIGELGLDGRLSPVRGVLPAVAAAAAAGFGAVVVPAENAAEAALVPGMRVIAAPQPRRAARMAARRQPGRDPRMCRVAGTAGLQVFDGRVRPPTRHGHLQPARSAAGSGAAAATWPTWSGSRSPGEPPRSARRAAITCCCSDRPASARPCWPSGCPTVLPRLEPAAALEVTRDPLGRRDAAAREPAA